MLKLFQVAYRFKLNIQPQLIMLQKTLLNIEGLGRDLYPELDVLQVAKPELEAIMREKHGLDQTAKDLRERLPGWLSKAPEMPGLLHDYLQQATTGKLTSRLDSSDLAALRRDIEQSHRRSIRVMAGAALMLTGALLLGLEAGPWRWFELSALGLCALLPGIWILFRALNYQAPRT